MVVMSCDRELFESKQESFQSLFLFFLTTMGGLG